MAERYEGTCTECGEECMVTLIDEVTSLCDDCIYDLDYIMCDNCEEFWQGDAVRFAKLNDGRMLCEHCLEELLDDEEIDEDDIEELTGNV